MSVEHEFQQNGPGIVGSDICTVCGKEREDHDPREWLIRKGGYYYRHNYCGYTTRKIEAGRYTKAKAEAEAAVEPWHMSAVHQDEVPDEPAVVDLCARNAELEATVSALKAELASSERPDLVAQLDALIIKHRAEVVAWFDARFPEAKHIPHPDRPSERAEIAHDGFTGDIIGHYVTREGKRGVVVQQDGTRVVHVYGEKWLPAAPSPALREEDNG